MNLYLRYIDRETLVSTVDEAIDFLRDIEEIGMDPDLEADIREYVASDVFYPKRYKGVIKRPTPVVSRLNEIRPGWYEGSLDFKRVLLIPGTGKFQYSDTQFVARVKAASGQDCYERIVDYLRDRVDERSQFPSAKGKNFRFTYLGKAKQL